MGCRQFLRLAYLHRQLLEHLGGEHILAKDGEILTSALAVANAEIVGGIARLGLLAHAHHPHRRMLLVLPHPGKDAVVAHLGQGDGMDAHHQSTELLVLLDELQRTGFLVLRTIDGVAQHQQHRLVARKVDRLIDGMAETKFLALVDEMEALANLEDGVLVGLIVGRQLLQMLLR